MNFDSKVHIIDLFFREKEVGLQTNDASGDVVLFRIAVSMIKAPPEADLRRGNSLVTCADHLLIIC